jgi:DNA-binding MurR/RpiR family transcriptional regulator
MPRAALNRSLANVPPARKQLGAAGRRVAAFLDQNREIVLASSAAELGANIGTSDATVVRTVQALGFAGLGDFKRAILSSMVTGSTPADDMRRTLADLKRSTKVALDNVLQTHDDGLRILKSAACRAQIAAATHALDASQRIVVFGIGPSAGLASYVATLLNRSGRRSRTLNATGSMLADQLLDLRAGDSILLLAYGRLYEEVSAVQTQAKALNLPIVLMTESSNTTLAKRADVVIAVPRGRPGNVAFHAATIVGLEALVLSLAAARPADALKSLDRLGELRSLVAGERKFKF